MKDLDYQINTTVGTTESYAYGDGGYEVYEVGITSLK